MAVCCMNHDLILVSWQLHQLLHIWQLTLLEEIEVIFSQYPGSFSSTILIATCVAPVAPITEPNNCKDFTSCCWYSEIWRETTSKQGFVLLRKTSICLRHWETKMNKYSSVPSLSFKRSRTLKKANEWRKKENNFPPPSSSRQCFTSVYKSLSKRFSCFHQEKELFVKYGSETSQIHFFLFKMMKAVEWRLTACS